MIINMGEKLGIITLAKFVNAGKYDKQTLIVKDTGSNKYTIYVENIPNNGLHYSILKVNKSGNVVGTIQVDRVSEYGIEYNNTVSNLPDSVVKYIKNHYITFHRYLKLGDKAF